MAGASEEVTTVAETFIFRGSSRLSEASYEPDVEDLTLTFQDDSQYLYRNVPNQVYRGLCSAGSPGQYFDRQIKGRFGYERL